MSSGRALETLVESQQLDDFSSSFEDDLTIDDEESFRPPMRRTYSMRQQKRRPSTMNEERIVLQRRLSHDAESMDMTGGRKFVVDVEPMMHHLLAQEDTDGDTRISVTDSGPKSVTLGTVGSNGYKSAEIRGTYMLSSLLQELAIAQDKGEQRVIIDETQLTENPVARLSRMIRDTFWDNLTRRIDADGLEQILCDTKGNSSSAEQIIYVPENEKDMVEYYFRVARERPALNLVVEKLPENFTPEYARNLNSRPGLLAIAMEARVDPNNGLVDMCGIPFVVPGARFNELYNWDSYFIALGLIEDNRIDLAKGAVEHFIFEIKHYHKILNGNRSYYLTRSQPPFLTDFALRVYAKMNENLHNTAPTSDDFTPAIAEAEEKNKAWLRRAIQAAIKEYHTVWMRQPRYDPGTGLSRYHPEGLGVPPETESSHFTSVLRPYAEKYGCSINEFTRKYNYSKIHEPELDQYFCHDRAVRESGHDTSYRLENRCANLVTIDLNALLYKYEMDIANTIRDVFDDHLELVDDFSLYGPLPNEPNTLPPNSRSTPQHSAEWFVRAAFRKQQVDKYLWNYGQGLYFDYDIALQEQGLYESVTSFWALWAGLATQEQADRMVKKSIHKFEMTGGLVPGTEESRGPISLSRPNRQWDYPFAWPPHQMLAWEGLKKYNHMDVAQRLAYRWLYLLVSAFVDFNGVVPEKFDAVNLSHLVNAEYGNQGTEFTYVPREGFGWMNASFQVGLTYLDSHMRKAVAAMQRPDDFFRVSQAGLHDRVSNWRNWGAHRRAARTP
ncbi:alpha,alpha-trehalase [Malassezia vespertilionis]|uniref:Trehalase n=1 Tax=Malassezia vespertilionis TaxID=2020962 RepID=A0A2N1JFT0_9BASI|nr:alpha,alpha-trehalase [Malassezia vespertilionis]PKI85403.1 Nth1p [Malassezia vespertilionis]WFD04804.1 alpha,alpha-trehalase [Malassezia vespertilionis]